MMVSRSSKAPVSRSKPKTSVHSWKGRLLVTSVEARSLAIYEEVVDVATV